MLRVIQKKFPLPRTSLALFLGLRSRRVGVSLYYQTVNFDDVAEDKVLHEKRQQASLRVKGLVRRFLMQGD